MKLTPQELRDLFCYNPNTGQFYWRCDVGHRMKSGDKAGSLNGRGYITLRYKRHPMAAHRAAWAIVHGAWPTREIDHINGIRNDNRIANLRECTRRQNEYNKLASSTNQSGIRGVRAWPSGKYTAQIRINGRLTHIGTFDAAQDAENAYKAAAARVCGVFASHLSRSLDTTA